jgi:riboflavin transporter FmnP
MKINTKKMVYCALLIAVGVLLPELFHLIGGTAAGASFLPMHIPVLIGGLLLGKYYGSAIGALAPVLAFLTSGMPTAERLPFMIIELAVYGFVSGILSKHLYPALIISMILGRIAYAASLVMAFYLFKMSEAAPIAAWTAVIKGLPGIIIQLLIIPPVVYALRRYTLEGRDFKSKENS